LQNSTGNEQEHRKEELVTTQKQREAAKRNIKKAQTAAKKKRTLANLPKETRHKLGKEGAKAAAAKRKKG
jgi:hypothetical protein